MSLIHWAWNRALSREGWAHGTTACNGRVTSRITIHSDQVTCPACLEKVAERVEEALDEPMIKVGVSGTPGTVVSAGTRLERGGGDWAITTEDYTIGLDGEVEVEVKFTGVPPT